MPDVNESTTSAVLLGGPADIPESLRSHPVDREQHKIKLLHCGGYEHFENTGEVLDAEGQNRVVYRWTTRTRIAE